METNAELAIEHQINIAWTIIENTRKMHVKIFMMKQSKGKY